ncbi:hypothetical protein [Microcoleus sp. CAWBG58]|uniref:hypothetical protein n=1 Tax=Microcoleus sp. CAWBG58 TaxID=2841651 RepID=UPI0025E56980|nr:hypothetical protein [Microcoleus sp. CAWBG58]
MKQFLTLVVKLQVDINQQQMLIDTASAFASACNWINQNVNPGLTNRNSVQAVCYKEVKEQFQLTANHVVRACARIAANRLTAKHKGKKVKSIQPTSFDCDARTFRFIESNWTVSISTIGKRLTAPIRASSYHRDKLQDQQPTSAQICLHRDGDWYSGFQKDSRTLLGLGPLSGTGYVSCQSYLIFLRKAIRSSSAQVPNANSSCIGKCNWG